MDLSIKSVMNHDGSTERIIIFKQAIEKIGLVELCSNCFHPVGSLTQEENPIQYMQMLGEGITSIKCNLYENSMLFILIRGSTLAPTSGQNLRELQIPDFCKAGAGCVLQVIP